MKRLALFLAVAALAGCIVKKSTYQKALDENKKLQGELTTAQGQISDDDKHIKDLDGQLTKTKSDLDALSQGKQLTDQQLADQQKQLAELQAKQEADAKRLEAFNDLKKRFKALTDSGTLQVVFRRGQMTLKLPSGVLFSSGAADLSTDGQTTLAQVTQVLMSFKDRRFLIAGHTDNVPINTKKFKNNWYLSTARAVSVLEYMVAQGFPQAQLAAAGYADTDPVGDNNTKDGQEQNRRIEIILVPDLSELPSMDDSDETPPPPAQQP
jgi:chemotaxis protein MotB